MKKKISLILIGIVIIFGVFLYSDSTQASTFKAIHVKLDVDESQMFIFYGTGLTDENFHPSQNSYTKEGTVYNCPIFLDEEDNGPWNDNHLIMWVHIGETIKKESASYLTDGIWYAICPDRSSPGCEVSTDTFNDEMGPAWTVATRPFGSISDLCGGNCTLSVSNTEYRPAKDLYCNASGNWEEIEPAPPITCTDTDNGQNLGTYGECKENGVVKCQDLCYDQNTLWECYCKADHMCGLVSLGCPSGQYCSVDEKRCVSGPPEPKCDDTDGGKDYNTLGSCYEIDGSESLKGTDDCKAGSNTILIEWYCDSGTKRCKTEEHNCSPKGCSSGICTTVTPTCEDTDGGINYTQQGTCSDSQGSRTDYCEDSTFLLEYYCAGGYCTGSSQKCSSGGCQNGKCAGTPVCMRPACEGLENGQCQCGTNVIENQWCCAASNRGYDTRALCEADSACVPSTCQCSDGTSCNQCKTGSPPSYCDGTTETLINKCSTCGCPTGQNCQTDGSCTTAPSTCGNGVCDPGENITNCPADCAVVQRRCVEDLGGYCCNSQYCLTGHEKTGATDCWRCCDRIENCTTTGGITIEIQNPLNATSFEAIVDNVIDFIFKIMIVLAPLMVVVGGFLFLTAGGNVEQIGRAKKLLLWAAIGFIVVLLSKGILGIIETILGRE